VSAAPTGATTANTVDDYRSQPCIRTTYTFIIQRCAFHMDFILSVHIFFFPARGRPTVHNMHEHFHHLCIDPDPSTTDAGRKEPITRHKSVGGVKRPRVKTDRERRWSPGRRARLSCGRASRHDGIYAGVGLESASTNFPFSCSH
jgi:hypothetical protein